MCPHIVFFSRHDNVCDDFQASQYPSVLAATSRRIEFVSYGLVFHLQLLSTPPRGDAVTFDYGVIAFSDTDFHRAVYAPSQAHLGFLSSAQYIIDVSNLIPHPIFRQPTRNMRRLAGLRVRLIVKYAINNPQGISQQQPSNHHEQRS